MNRRSRARVHRAAVLESLEHRRLLNAAIVVNTTDDAVATDAFTSLREAITQAQTDAGDDTITFDPAVFTPGSLHTISLNAELELSGANGKVTITGPGADVLALSGQDAHRIFHIDPGAVANISGAKIFDGTVNVANAVGGGGIVNFGSLTLSAVWLADNTASGTKSPAGNSTTRGGQGGTVFGGAIDNLSLLSVDNCTFTGNIALGGGGGSGEGGGGAGGSGLGGAIYAFGPLTVTNSRFDHNTAQSGRAGVHIGGDADLSSGEAAGGDIGIGSVSPAATITQCNFTNSLATAAKGADGDGLFLAGTGGSAEGGSIYSDSINLQISQCGFNGAIATAGAGGDGDSPGSGGAGGHALGGVIFSEGVATIHDISIDHGTVTGGDAGSKASAGHNAGFGSGGGIYNFATMHLSEMGIADSEVFGGFSHSSAAGGDAQGGGIANALHATLDMTACSVDSCSASGGTSNNGTPGRGFGGGIYPENQITLDSVDVKNNAATGGHTDINPTGLNGTDGLGGGLFLSGAISADIRNSAIHDNLAQGGGGGTGTAGAGGHGGAGKGGGIYQQVPLTLVNSTVYGNRAAGGAGGVGTTTGGQGGTGHGGGIEMDNTLFDAINVTIAANIAEGGAGGSGPTPGQLGFGIAGGIVNGDATTLTNTIVADNQAADEGPDLEGDFTLIHSLVSAPPVDYAPLAGSHDNLLNTPADLGPLDNHGGFTPTTIPSRTSAAVNAGDNAAAIDASLDFDQRGTGFPRIVSGVVDIGAAEVPLPIFTLLGNGQTISDNDTTPSSLDFTDFGTAKLGTPIDRTFTIRNDGTDTLNVGMIDLPVGFSVLTLDSPTVDPGNTTTLTLRFNPGTSGAFGGTATINNDDLTIGNKFQFTLAATALPAAGNAFRVNFQPASAEVPSGYLLDAGSVFGSRGNGYSYGWNASAASFTRDRNAVADQAFDTLVHTQQFGSRTWEVSVPNGTYSVHLVAGDPSFFDSVYKVNVEGVLVVNGTPTSGNRFVQGTKSVTVTDGKLTITNAAGAVNNKLDFVEVTPTSPPPPSTIKVNFQTTSSATPAGFLADSGAVFGSRGNGQSYGWNSSASSFARDRNVLSDQSRDTFIHTQLYGVRIWELAVPNGSYSVHIVAGDPSFTDSVYKFNAEGQLALSGTPTGGNHFVEGTKTVAVSDGRLTVTNASGSVNNKIDFIEVTPV